MTPTTERIDYEVLTARGALAFTSPDPVLARQWLAERRETYPGAYVEEVTRTEIRRRAYTPRLRVVA